MKQGIGILFLKLKSFKKYIIRKMKSLILIFLFFSICSPLFAKNSHHSQKKLHHKHKITPKADDLNNHFGYPSDDSPYGPHHEKIVVVNTINAPTVISPCDITIQPYYDICSPLLTCGSCSSSPYCGKAQFHNNFIPFNFFNGFIT